jgi:hypothetical protein
MSVVPQPVRPGLKPDEAVGRYLEVVRRDIEPDPLFRRRLRGAMVNRFVAEREGSSVARPPRSSRMGRLGRACLYASVATAVSIGGVMAASESAIPGGLLYPLKLRVEEIRLTIAPAHLRDDLVADSLAERIDELGRLVESGDYGHAIDLAASITAAYGHVRSDGSAVTANSIAHQLVRLEVALDRVPDTARRAIERAMSFAPGLQPDANADGGADAAGGGSTGEDSSRDGGSTGQMDSGSESSASGAIRTPRAERSPEPEVTPKPERTGRPEPSARPEEPPKPTPAAP